MKFTTKTLKNLVLVLAVVLLVVVVGAWLRVAGLAVQCELEEGRAKRGQPIDLRSSPVDIRHVVNTAPAGRR